RGGPPGARLPLPPPRGGAEGSQRSRPTEKVSCPVASRGSGAWRSAPRLADMAHARPDDTLGEKTLARSRPAWSNVDTLPPRPPLDGDPKWRYPAPTINIASA